MPIDASIYQNLRPVEIASPLDAYQKAMTLSHMSNQVQRENAAQDREDQQRKLLAVGTAVEDLAGMPEDKRPVAYKDHVNSLVKSGVLKPDDVPPEYDPGYVRNVFSQLNSSPQYLAIKKAQGDIASSKNDPIDRDLDRQIKKSTVAKNFAEAGKLSKEGDGKPLAAEQSDKLAGHDASLHMIGDLRSAIDANKDDFGPVSGRLSSMNPYNQRGQEVSALFKKAAQTIGKSLEGGKLTDQDFEKYQKMLPTQTDIPEVANAKLDQLERMIVSQRNADLNTYGRAGSNVRNFSQTTPPDIEVSRPKKSGNGIGVGPNEASASTMPKPGAEDGGYVFMGGDPSDQKSWKRAK